MKKIIIILLSLCTVTPCLFAEFYADGDERYSNRMASDSNDLWIASNKGLIQYNKTTGERKVANALLGLADTTKFISVYVDKENNLWTGTREYEVVKYDGKGTSFYVTPDKTPYPLLRYCYTMVFDADEKPFMGALFYYYFQFAYSEKHNVYLPEKHTILFPTSSNGYPLMDMAFDSKGVLWCLSLTHPGLSLDVGPNNHKMHKQAYGTSIKIDQTDNIWIATDKGILCYNPTTDVTTEYNSNTRQDVPEGIYTASDMDSEGNLWFSATDFLLKYDGQNFTRYACDGYTEARSLLCDGSVVWIYLNSDELLRFENGNFTRTNLGAPMGIDSPEAISTNYTVTCDANGTLSITGNEEIASVSLYTALGTLVSTTQAGGQQQITLPAACPTIGALYIVKIRTAQHSEWVTKVVR